MRASSLPILGGAQRLPVGRGPVARAEGPERQEETSVVRGAASQEDCAAVGARLINAAADDDAVVMAWGVNGLSEGMIRHWMHDGRRRSASEMAALTTRLAWGGLERLV